MDGTAVKAMMAEIAPVIREYVETSFGALQLRIDELEKRAPPQPEKGDPGEQGPPGVGVNGVLVNRDGALVLTLSDGSTHDLGEVTSIQREARQADELRAAEHRAFLAEQRETMSGLIRKVEEKLAEVKDGEPGTSVNMDEVRLSIREAVEVKIPDVIEEAVRRASEPVKEHVAKAVADIPKPKDGEPGKDADMEALHNELVELVASFPIPKDGEPGKDAYPGMAKGLFDPEATYRAMDVVSFNGSEWRAKTDDPGPLPGDGWMLSASKGKRGDRGERGPVGIGKDGKDGANPIAIKFDADKMEFVMALDDGNVLEADFYPVAKAIRGEG